METSELWSFLDKTVETCVGHQQQHDRGIVESMAISKKRKNSSEPELRFREPSSASNGLKRTASLDVGSSMTSKINVGSRSLVRSNSATYELSRSYIEEKPSANAADIQQNTSYKDELSATETEDDDDELQMKSIHELRLSGEKQRIMDEIEYLVDGVSQSRSPLAAYSSLLEICTHLDNTMFRLCLKSNTETFFRVFKTIISKDLLRSFFQLHILASISSEVECVKALIDLHGTNILTLLRTTLSTDGDALASFLKEQKLSKNMQSAVHAFIKQMPALLGLKNMDEEIKNPSFLASLTLFRLLLNGLHFTTDVQNLLNKAVGVTFAKPTVCEFLVFLLCDAIEHVDCMGLGEKGLRSICAFLSRTIVGTLDEESSRLCIRVLQLLIQITDTESALHPVDMIVASGVPRSLFLLLQKVHSCSELNDYDSDLLAMVLGLLLDVCEDSSSFAKAICDTKCNDQTYLSILQNFYKISKDQPVLEGYSAAVLSLVYVHGEIHDHEDINRNMLVQTLEDFVEFHKNLEHELSSFGANELAVLSVLRRLIHLLQEKEVKSPDPSKDCSSSSYNS
ncbi:hypothetical protein SJAG_02606 [Schizosaccharomyces japonicus yFS275]|uniref:Wings apart-like protein C-terminal domain-containing protein n=1 Tax=Schizosaccharomyces japonicus (strain yFS275 / FY16936) TaxID=402676 RepID=B6K0P8_SCHJY|nr:hypothetical protein SJAG_02606 [Schizosaccharomyces japonicus yFS275]EEB07519.1 hypothetical protein SJAG_02606 [Schizosaccharomyces japonicus yFS275]